MNFLSFFSGTADRQFASSVRNVLGFSPRNINLYQQAFRHRSAAYEIREGVKSSNERLEYLGDAILGAVVAEFLFKKFPFRDEGFLTEMRSRIVSRESLNRLAVKLGIDQFVKNSTDSWNKGRSIYGDAFEALVGAVYLDRGYEKAGDFIINRIIKNHVDIDAIETTDLNFKSKLVEWSQRERKTLAFDLADVKENGDGRLFTVRILLNDAELSRGVDFSRKRAEQLAAENACKALNI